MKEIPNKIYVPQHNIEAGNIQELGEPIVAGSTEYVRKDALLEWAENMKLICKGAEPLEKAYQTMIDRIELL